MAELLTQKLAQLEAIASNARQSIENAKSELESTLAPRISQELQTRTEQAKQELQTQLESKKSELETQLESKKQTLESTINQTLQEAKSTFRQEFTQHLQSQLTNIASNFTKSATKSLQDTLAPQVLAELTQSPEMKERITHAAKESASEFIAELDLQELINYARIDTAQIAKDLSKLESFAAQIKKTYTEVLEQHIQNLDRQSLLKQALKANAKHIYTQALASDDLLRQRYETKLHLLAQSIETTQIALERQLRHSSRLYALEKRPPISEEENRNNILVAR